MAKPSTGRPPTRWVGESGVTSSGMLRLERLELVQQRVELVVGDLGIVVDVVALFVMPDRVAELRDAVGGSMVCDADDAIESGRVAMRASRQLQR